MAAKRLPAASSTSDILMGSPSRVATTVEPSLPDLAGAVPLAASVDVSVGAQLAPPIHMATRIQDDIFVSSDISLTPFESLQLQTVHSS
jgi:hypothetical protein